MQVSVKRLAQYPLGAVWSGHVRGALCGPSPRLPITRPLFSETGVWDKVYQTETRRRVEAWWHPRIMARWKESAGEVRPFKDLLMITDFSRLRMVNIMKPRITEQKLLLTFMSNFMPQSSAAAETTAVVYHKQSITIP